MDVLVKDFSFGYTNKKILNNISFKISNGDAVLVLGHNGAGKTTLIKAILNKLNIKKENIYIDNTDVTEFHKWGEVAYVPQDLDIVGFPINVYEFLTAFNRNHSDKEVNDILEKLNISDLKFKNLNKLSGGERRKVFIARALCNDISMIIMDEPLNAIDESSSSDIIKILKDIAKKGLTIIIITHDFKELKDIASHVLEIEGSVKFFGTCDEYERREGR